MTENEILREEAVRLACLGMPVFPLSGKNRPLIRWGKYMWKCPGSVIVEAWWDRQFPGANIGLIMGPVSGLMCIDCDSVDDIGRALVRFPELHNTLQAQSGSGIGRHFYLSYVPGVPTTRRKFGPHTEICSVQSYVCYPPSRSAKGNVYQWLNHAQPIMPSAPLVAALIKAKTARPARRHLPMRIAPTQPGQMTVQSSYWTIPEGRRNQEFFAMACRWRRNGASHRSILETLHSNMGMLERPLPEEELVSIANGACRR